MKIYFDSWGGAYKDYGLAQPVKFTKGVQALVALDRAEWSIGITDWAIAQYFGYQPISNECGPDTCEIPVRYFSADQL